MAGLPDCLPGAALNSNMTKLQQQKVVTKLKEGKIAILLVSPEALVSGGFGTGIYTFLFCLFFYGCLPRVASPMNFFYQWGSCCLPCKTTLKESMELPVITEGG